MALVKLAKQKKAERKAGKAVASAAGPGGVLTSFVGGIQDLTDSTVSALRGEVRTGAAVAEIVRKDGGYELRLEDGETVEAEVVVSAAPAYAVTDLVAGLDRQLTQLLGEIPYATMNVVCFGYAREKIARDLDGFGYLIPKKEGKNILGTLWDSSIFPNRAPEGRVLLRSMMGGATNPGAINLPESEVKARVMADLKEIMGISAEPDFVRIFRHEKAIPQYIAGHGQRLRALAARQAAAPGFFLAGNAFYGVGLNDCVHAANQVAGQVVELLRERQGGGKTAPPRS
jgi:oxygen-dependent protoporphyrinogen oxidase